MTGRELPPTSAFAGDDGSADPRVVAALDAVAAGTGTAAGVVEALAGTRVLVPVLAELEASETVEVAGHAHTVDKEASAGIVALQAPDGRTALPVFSSVAAMAAWRTDARPVPTEIARAALSAVDEGWELLVLDAGGPTTVLVPRPAVWALAQQQPWRPAVVDDGTGPAVDPEVRDAVRSAVLAAVGPVPAGAARRSLFRRPAAAPLPPPSPVVDVDAVPGSRAEVAVVLTLVPGLDRTALDAVLARVGEALAAQETVAQRVDSLEVRLR
ncbi:SseB family protein [Cellulomonas hominis]|uniref:SseB family protein n=1 Tax=Cellulomonas hominis TaxID=156981 RepID=UPI001B8ECC44|nr:SseB family protein [Cellulomonas hominis]VTR78610.1 hypothetical protein CHMI_03393 [Cellulomonas hominis]